VFQEGDVLVTGASAPVWGYLSELERTMVICEPTSEQERMFEHMVALQDIAFAAIKPGALCSDVDNAVRAYFDEHLFRTAPHGARSGCAATGPFLDSGDHRDQRGLHRRAASTPPTSGASAIRTLSSSPRTASRSSRTTRATSRA
jgi:Xaa-Pro aminopeptidase